MVGLSDENSKNYRGIVQYFRKHRTEAIIEPIDPTITDTSHSPDVKVDEYRQKHKYLSESETKALIQDYEDGSTTYELAKKYGCHRVTVSAILKRNGVRLRDHWEYPRFRYC